MVPVASLTPAPQSKEGEGAPQSELGNGSNKEEWFGDEESKEGLQEGLTLKQKGNSNRSLEEEPRILIEALNKVEYLKRLFELYEFRWMARTLDEYNAKIIRKFYDDYLETLENYSPTGQKVKDQPRLDSVSRGRSVDISERTIARLLYCPNIQYPAATTEYGYRMEALKRSSS
ncbi:hypothetical protein HAX54_051380 [Datura stramonium]|uniref:Uncharacterized protein n=1 Tax=Datura stramonium TaxID=4076 RepID=A0ABS8SY61_DATST|nr:hypothetical protein [Datura stramonium]